MQLLKIIQNNLKKSQTFTNQMLYYADEVGVDICCIQEPYSFKRDQDHNYVVTGFGREFEVFHCKSSSKSKN
jgi:hypothetical protein